ncbi:MAG: IS4 family transposase [Elusimicrobia bacterium]|nr:IS4 family transposase [Elusimicrobiota bacterium]
MGLYRDLPIENVVRRLDLVLPGEDGEPQTVGKGAICTARARVGAEPLRTLFGVTAERWGLESADRYRWHGLVVLGGDGVTLRVPDSPENREEFHLPGSARRSAGYPQIRGVGLMDLRSRKLVDFDFADCKTGELTLAGPLLARVPDHSVSVLDRLYVDYCLLHGIRSLGERRHWLLRARKNLKWKVIQRLGRGDDLVEVTISYAARRKHPELPKTFLARVIRYHRKGFRRRTLLTSLLDPKQYPAAEIADLYCERWELELAYDEIKTHTLDREEAIRSKTPDGVRQEVWGLLIAYNLVRHEMECVALERGVAPRRISFLYSLRVIRDVFYWAAMASPGSLPKMVKRMRLDVGKLLLPERRTDRRYPRHVKIKMSGYLRNDGHPA